MVSFYDQSKSLKENVMVQRNRHCYTCLGNRFRSLWHLNSAKQSKAITLVLKKCIEVGCFHFHSGGITKKDGIWIRQDDSKNAVRVNLVDKLKVITASQSVANATYHLASNSLDGVQEKAPRGKRRSNGAADVFLQGLLKVARPSGTIANYKRTDSTHSCHAHDMYKETMTVNKTNVNLPRGMHEYVVLNRTAMANIVMNCPNSRARLVLDINTGNNNSLTTDSVINAVSNGITFKASASLKNNDFVLAPMTDFGTHKTVAVFGQENFENQALAPLKGNEIQVHEHCYNCSAIAGEKLLPAICAKGADLLEENNITVSLAVNNAKSLLEVASHSLVPSSMNSFVDLLCWKHCTRKMSREEEMVFFEERLKPLLKTMTITRENYAQSGSFCQYVPKTSNMFYAPEMKLVSHKFKNPVTNKFFQRASLRWPEIMTKVNQLNRKRPLITGYSKGKKSKYRDAVLSSQPARNEGIVRRYELGPAVFRDRFPYPPPIESEI